MKPEGQQMTDKPSNPKDHIGVAKVPLHLVPPTTSAYLAVAHYLGATKYGAWNWRVAGVRASVYCAALRRHVEQWFSGEKYDIDDTPHLANALACLSILIDAECAGKLIDDRPLALPLNKTYAEVEAIMAKIKKKYGHLDPKHWTIDDKG